MKKRILFVIGYPHRMAGSQRQIEHLILNLPKNYSPELWVSMEGGVSQNFFNKSIVTHVFNTPLSLNIYGKKSLSFSRFKMAIIFFKDYISFSFRLWKFLKKNKFDIIHCNDARAVILFALVSFFTRSKLITHIQGERPIANNFLWKLFEFIPKVIIANADFVKNTLNEKVWNKTKVIYTGISSNTLSDELKSKWLLDQSKNRVIISCFASIVPFKGYHHLIEAIDLLQEDNSVINDYLFLFVGDIVKEYEYYFDWLNGSIRNETTKEAIIFTGWQDNPFPFIKIADFTTLPSVKDDRIVINGEQLVIQGNEGFPTTHLEAMGYSKPIVGTAIAGVPEQISHNVNGLIVEPGDPIALKKALKELIDNKILRQQFGMESLRIIQSKFSLKKYVHQVTEIYDSL